MKYTYEDYTISFDERLLIYMYDLETDMLIFKRERDRTKSMNEMREKI